MNRQQEIRADVAVIGAGMGGVAAALAAARAGYTVILTEATDWIGGQVTSQGVPPDEHPWIEKFGCTASYRSFRDGVRDYYRQWYPLTTQARATRALNTGNGRVSSLCAEPRAALAVLDGMLAPHRAAGRIDLRLHYRPVAADVENDTVTAVTVEHVVSGDQIVISAPYVLDATETGDLLPLTGTEHVTGFESQKDTGEPSAPTERQPLNMQAVSWCFAIEHRAGEDHTIDKPDDYEFWRDYRPPYWPGPMFSMVAPSPRDLQPAERALIPHGDTGHLGGDTDMWQFRRILDRSNFAAGTIASDVVIVNWPMIDYVEGPLFGPGIDAAARAAHTEGALRMSRSFLYWMQTELPTPGGASGLPGLRLRGDTFGTEHGLAKAPYIRESRRVAATYTVVEQDVALAQRRDRGAAQYEDSVGIGSYRIDLHPSTGGDNYIDVASTPFQIPLGAMLPVRVRNLVPAAKNIGTTHITNGCYRLHPVEWNIGEAAGALVAYCLTHRASPHQVREDQDHLATFQKSLRDQGVELAWPKIHGW